MEDKFLEIDLMNLIEAYWKELGKHSIVHDMYNGIVIKGNTEEEDMYFILKPKDFE